MAIPSSTTCAASSSAGPRASWPCSASPGPSAFSWPCWPWPGLPGHPRSVGSPRNAIVRRAGADSEMVSAVTSTSSGSSRTRPASPATSAAARLRRGRGHRRLSPAKTGTDANVQVRGVSAAGPRGPGQRPDHGGPVLPAGPGRARRRARNAEKTYGGLGLGQHVRFGGGTWTGRRDIRRRRQRLRFRVMV